MNLKLSNEDYITVMEIMKHRQSSYKSLIKELQKDKHCDSKRYNNMLDESNKLGIIIEHMEKHT